MPSKWRQIAGRLPGPLSTLLGGDKPDADQKKRGYGYSALSSEVDAEPLQPFRFCDLPREIRHEIYRLWLCSFGTKRVPHGMPPVFHLDGQIEAAILRTNNQIYHEAYEIMVKTNRFVRIQSMGFDMRAVLSYYKIPVVTANLEHVKQFRGYILGSKIAMKSTRSSRREEPTDRAGCILLAKDLEYFCLCISLTLQDGGGVSIRVGPLITERPAVYLGSMAPFFAGSVPRTLLEAFPAHLRGLEYVKVDGAISNVNAEALEARMRQGMWDDAADLLRMVKDRMTCVYASYHAGDRMMSALFLSEVTDTIEWLRTSDHWDDLVEQGGHGFLNTLVGQFITATMNRANIEMEHVHDADRQTRNAARDTVNRALIFLEACIKGNIWADGFEWTPTRRRYKGRIFYHLARYARELDYSWEHVRELTIEGLQYMPDGEYTFNGPEDEEIRFVVDNGIVDEVQAEEEAEANDEVLDEVQDDHDDDVRDGYARIAQVDDVEGDDEKGVDDEYDDDEDDDEDDGISWGSCDSSLGNGPF